MTSAHWIRSNVKCIISGDFGLSPLLCFFGPRPKRKILLFPEIWVTWKIFTRAAAIFFNQFNWIFKIKFTLEELLYTTFLFFWKNKETFYCSKGTKRQFVRINWLVEKHFNGESYWPNVFHYGFKIQSLRWTLHCRSHNLQPASTF